MKIYQELDQLISAALTGKGFRKVEEYHQQYNNSEKKEVTNYPVCYYELQEPVQWSTQGNNLQSATIVLKLHVVDFYLVKEKNRIHENAQKAYIALQGKGLTDDQNRVVCSRMMRVGSSMPKSYDQLKVVEIDFTTQLLDYSAMPQNVVVVENGKVTLGRG